MEYDYPNGIQVFDEIASKDGQFTADELTRVQDAGDVSEWLDFYHEIGIVKDDEDCYRMNNALFEFLLAQKCAEEHDLDELEIMEDELVGEIQEIDERADVDEPAELNRVDEEQRELLELWEQRIQKLQEVRHAIALHKIYH